MTPAPTTWRIPFVILEGKKPGQMAFTLMSCFPHSAASARVKERTAPLLALYATVCISGGFPARPATEEMFTIFPERRGIMQRFPTCWETRNMASMLRPITFRQAS